MVYSVKRTILFAQETLDTESDWMFKDINFSVRYLPNHHRRFTVTLKGSAELEEGINV